MQHTCIIAEAGVNHNGNPEIAYQLIDAAAEAGVDIVKFQAFRASAVISAHAPKAAYQEVTTGAHESQLEMVRKLELPPEIFPRLAAHCSAKGVEFLATPFDSESIDLLRAMGLSTFKIPSGEITNVPYLRKVGALKKKLLLSTGMSSLAEAAFAVDELERTGTPRSLITLLHCTTEYPAPFSEINLKAIPAMIAAFPDMQIGYSDHTEGVEISLAAVALGAVVIEKHFTLDRSMEGPDHAASLEPRDLATLVRSIRHIEAAMGDGIKRASPSEEKNKMIARKSIFAARSIQEGELLTAENLTTKRPGTGLSPVLWDAVLGTKASRRISQDEML